MDEEGAGMRVHEPNEDSVAFNSFSFPTKHNPKTNNVHFTDTETHQTTERPYNCIVLTVLMSALLPWRISEAQKVVASSPEHGSSNPKKASRRYENAAASSSASPSARARAAAAPRSSSIAARMTSRCAAENSPCHIKFRYRKKDNRKKIFIDCTTL
jgi:hypothetical protein